MQLFLRLLRKNRVASGWVGLFALMPIVSSSFGSWLVYTYEVSIQQWLWPVWLVVYLLVALGMALALVPTTMVAITGGYLLGAYSIPPMVMAYLLAVAISYFLARKVDGGGFKQSLLEEPAIQPYVESVGQNPVKTVIYAKLSPILPFGASNVLLAFLGIKLPPFLIGSFLGMLPRTLLATGVGWQANRVGEELSNAGSGQTATVWAILLLFTVFSLFGLGRILKRST